MTHSSKHILVLAFLVGVGCSSAAELETPRYTTTSGEIALRNLDSQIDGARKAFARVGDSAFAARLVDLLLLRTTYRGTYDPDFAEALAVAKGLLDEDPDNATALRTFAKAASAQHRFDDAQEALGGLDGSDTELSTLWLARGERLQEVLAIRQRATAQRRSYGTLVNLAAVLAACGEFDAADAAFVEALKRYGDVSPFPIAFVYFQRGVMWGEQANRPDRARLMYEEAVRVLPQYVVANVHLAEREAADGDLDLAITRLERIRKETADPEPTGLLAELLRSSAPDRAEVLAAEAEETYHGLLDRYPLAFLDHASEFFAAGIDPEHGLDLALQNLEYRRNHRAFIVAAEAALAAGHASLACGLAQEGLARPGRNLNLEKLHGIACAERPSP